MGVLILLLNKIVWQLIIAMVLCKFKIRGQEEIPVMQAYLPCQINHTK